MIPRIASLRGGEGGAKRKCFAPTFSQSSMHNETEFVIKMDVCGSRQLYLLQTLKLCYDLGGVLVSHPFLCIVSCTFIGRNVR